MKFFALGLAISFAIFMGFYPRLSVRKPVWWKAIAILILTVALVLTILPPLSGSFSDAIELVKSPEHKNVDVFLKFTELPSISDGVYKAYTQAAKPYTISGNQYGSDTVKHLILIPLDVYNGIQNKININDNYVFNLTYQPKQDNFKVNTLVSTNPILTYPYIAELVHRIKILNLHVPMSWTAFIAFFISMFYAIKYLRTKNIENDIFAMSAALMGLIFTLLATTTGMVWARFNWGAFWNWDPRQISIFILLMIYFAYFALRSSFENQERRATLSSVYSIISFVTVPFLIFIVPRLYTGLHPGAKGDGTTGPVIDPKAGMLDSSLAFTYYIALCGFIILFFWLLNITIRYNLASHKLRELEG